MTHHKGVYHVPGNPKPWRARVWDNGKRRHLGSFATQEEAIEVYEAAETTRVLWGPHRRSPAHRCPEDADWVEIELTQGAWCKVDLADLDKVMWVNWSLARGYAHRVEAGQNIFMHQVIMSGVGQVDHINLDPLDNRRANLRPADNSQNGANKRKTRGTSRYKGVHWNKAKKKWEAWITVRGVHRYLGCFTVEEAGARAYNQAALEAWGEYARVNQVPRRLLRRRAA